jgi:hypothetical protein
VYFHRNLVDVELVDEILGDSIIDAWEDEHIRKAIGAVRVRRMILRISFILRDWLSI